MDSSSEVPRQKRKYVKKKKKSVVPHNRRQVLEKYFPAEKRLDGVGRRTLEESLEIARDVVVNGKKFAVKFLHTGDIVYQDEEGGEWKKYNWQAKAKVIRAQTGESFKKEEIMSVLAYGLGGMTLHDAQLFGGIERKRQRATLKSGKKGHDVAGVDVTYRALKKKSSRALMQDVFEDLGVTPEFIGEKYEKIIGENEGLVNEPKNAEVVLKALGRVEEMTGLREGGKGINIFTGNDNRSVNFGVIGGNKEDARQEILEWHGLPAGLDPLKGLEQKALPEPVVDAEYKIEEEI